jgi:hypothetical protein
MFRFLERGFWLSALMLAALVLLVAVTGLNLGGGMPALPRLPGGEQPRWDWLEANRLAGWFSVSNAARFSATADGVNPFFTDYFKPPAPPQTKKVQVGYLGSFTSSRGERHAFVQLGEQTLVLTNGANVVADYYIREIEISSLILTNAAGQTNRVEFRSQAALQVPAR